MESKESWSEAEEAKFYRLQITMSLIGMAEQMKTEELLTTRDPLQVEKEKQELEEARHKYLLEFVQLVSKHV